MRKEGVCEGKETTCEDEENRGFEILDPTFEKNLITAFIENFFEQPSTENDIYEEENESIIFDFITTKVMNEQFEKLGIEKELKLSIMIGFYSEYRDPLEVDADEVDADESLS